MRGCFCTLKVSYRFWLSQVLVLFCFLFDSPREIVQFHGLAADHTLWLHPWLGICPFVRDTSMKVKMCLLRIYILAFFSPSCLKCFIPITLGCWVSSALLPSRDRHSHCHGKTWPFLKNQQKKRGIN